jgi:hypothetical protein
MKTNFMGWGFFPTYFAISGVFPSLAPYFTYLGQGSILVGIAIGYLSAADYTRQLIAAYDRIAAARAAGTAADGDAPAS